MASQPSVYNEERNLLRLQAWEQRNQETSQAKELNPENVPLFGEPYKINKGDELSNRIQRMLGSYEDVNIPYPFANEPLPIPTQATFSQSDPGQPNTVNASNPPFCSQVHHMSSHGQKAPSSNGYPSQPTRTSAASPPNHCGQSSTFSNASFNLSHSVHQQKMSETLSDIRERVSLPQEISCLSPDAKQPAFLRSSDQDNTDTDTKDTLDRHQPQVSTDHPSESVCLNLKQSPKDAPLPQANKGNTLPSQTFPSLLSSKQPSVVVTQKPTAYVRPMDGQDQVVSESPELKPSPEPYVPLQELINKTDLGKTKTLPQFLETRTNEAQCVEEILREMTHSWPPLLTAIHTPSTGEPSKSPFPAKEAEHVSSCPGQKNCNSSPADPPQLVQHGSSSSFEAAHSRGIESASTSDSESSLRSESDSEGTTEGTPQPPANKSVKTEPDAPAVAHGDWQLGNWIRSSQQYSSTESQSVARASKSPIQSSKPPSVEVVDPTRDSKPQPSSHQKEFTDTLCSQDNYNQQSSQKSPADLKSCSTSRKLSCSAHSSKPTKSGCPDHSEAALGVKCEEVVAAREKDPCFTDRPKVKTKTGPSKKSKDSSVTVRDSKRTSKHTSLDKRKAGPQATPVQCAHCPSCGVHYPNPCSCPPVPPVRTSCSKQKSETVCQKGTKIPHKTTHKHSEKTGHAAKSSVPPHRAPRSLLVKIDLSLLSRIPQTSGKHRETASNAERSALVTEHDGAHKLTKASKKNIPQNVEVDSKTVPRKKPRLENTNKSASRAPVKLESSCNSTDGRERKKAMKNKAGPLQQPLATKETVKDSKMHRCSSGETQETNKEAVKSKEARKHKKSSGKHPEHPHFEKQKKSSLAVPSSSKPTRDALTIRPRLRFDNRQYPVNHYIKEAKKLKHKADAESDKLSKAFNYLDAAMYFVESGIAMEKDPQISVSSYTMFAETVELLKFVLKLKNSVDPSAPPSEKDFLALCLKCQSLLQMAMFRHKHKTALKYSKTLTDHFNSSAQKSQDPSVFTSKVADTPSPMPSMPSPAISSISSGPGSNHSGSGSAVDPAGGSVVLPKAIEQVAFTYVNITTLCLSAHDVWEQAKELAQKGSGMLAELDTVMGPLSLTSSMSSMVRYTRQGVQWMRLDSQKVK